MKIDLLKAVSIIADFLTLIGVISAIGYTIRKKEINLTAFKISRVIHYMVRIAFILLILIGVFHLWRSIFLLSLQLFNGKIVNLYYWESGYEITYILSYFITLSLFLPVVWILGTLIWTSSFNLTKDFINLFLPENKLLKKFKPQLEIIKATYGSPQKFIDITAIIKQMIVNNTLSIKASNQLAGDPHEGVVKKLIIDYKYEDQPKTAEIREGLRIVIPENQPINQ